MDVEKIREDFPILRRKINGYSLIYLDSAATSQKPNQVIDAICNYYRKYNANVMRGVHTLSEQATGMYENTRKNIGTFINSKKTEEIIFVRNATEGLNLVMYCWGRKNIRKGDKIVVSLTEHHSNMVPWQALAQEKGATIEYLPVGKDGYLEESWKDKIRNAKMLAINHVSNVTGIENNVKEICDFCKYEGVTTVLDGSQSTPHKKIDVKKIDCDFFVFTGHKMLGPTGIGVLYGKQELLEEMDPFMYGGEMVKSVNTKGAELNSIPHKFEAGTPNIAGVIGLGAALDYLNKIGMEQIEKYEEKLTKYAMNLLCEISGIQLLGPDTYSKEKTGIISFNISGVHAHDVASILNEYGIAIRSGLHCSQPIHSENHLEASARASFYIYNNRSEIEKFADKIAEISNMNKGFNG